MGVNIGRGGLTEEIVPHQMFERTSDASKSFLVSAASCFSE